ncbi:hypothetical protein [Paludisphaera rhizosphaerae]|uniref:hypothetical protein n=1 Tax=Paludisphaera rhizosphaerae TaxID=2711216 RepID=UPI0013EDAA4B|nr:hypothetical protein [Paludisphaera rhizosphaerae]
MDPLLVGVLLELGRLEDERDHRQNEDSREEILEEMGHDPASPLITVDRLSSLRITTNRGPCPPLAMGDGLSIDGHRSMVAKSVTRHVGVR